MTAQYETADGYGRTFYVEPADYSIRESFTHTGNSVDGWVSTPAGWDVRQHRWYRDKRGEKDFTDELVSNHPTKDEASAECQRLTAAARAQ